MIDRCKECPERFLKQGICSSYFCAIMSVNNTNAIPKGKNDNNDTGENP